MAQTQKRKWEIIKDSFLEQIKKLDEDTMWTSDTEPEWWLEMMSIARRVRDDRTAG